MKNYDYFLYAVKNKLCTDNMVVDLYEDLNLKKSFTRTLHNFKSKALKTLSDAIASGNCMPGLTINLLGNMGGDASIKELLQCLNSRKRPKRLCFLLGSNGLTNKSMGYLSDALLKSFKIEGLTLDLNGSTLYDSLFGSDKNHIDDKGAIILANCLRELIKNDNCPKDLTIILSETSIGNLGANAIAQALEDGMRYNPARQTIQLKLPSRIDVNLQERITKDLKILNDRGVSLQNNSSVLFAGVIPGSSDVRNEQREHRLG